MTAGNLNMKTTLELAQNVLRIEGNAVLDAAKRFKAADFEELLQVLDNLIKTGGNLIFCGIGKSGIIAQKLSATFSSLGLPSYFLHPVEALHGDLGRVSNRDAIIFLSKSGTAEEILKLVPFLPIESKNKIGLIGDITSPLAQKCELVFDCSVAEEACLNNQAPTTSSTVTLAIGDAMAVVYESRVNLTKESFAVNHPGGILGKRLRMKVSDLMWEKKRCAHVNEEATLQEVILSMTQHNVGGCAILGFDNKLKGIMVEGDIRRTFADDNADLSMKIQNIMTKDPVTVKESTLAFDALVLMEQRQSQINILPIVNEANLFIGFIRLHDLLKEGFISK
jgi:arabinose-5-phosphate isomerase